MTEETAVQGRKVRFSPRAMVLAAGCLVLAGAVGRWAGRDGGLLWVARLFDHPLLFGVLVSGLLAAALIVAVRRLVVRVLTGVALGLVLLASFPFFLFGAFGAASETSDTVAGAWRWAKNSKISRTRPADFTTLSISPTPPPRRANHRVLSTYVKPDPPPARSR